MRLLVVYDSTGNISALATQPEGAPPLNAVLRPGERSGMVDAPEIRADDAPEEVQKKLESISKRYRVRPEPGVVEFVARDDPYQATGAETEP